MRTPIHYSTEIFSCTGKLFKCEADLLKYWTYIFQVREIQVGRITLQVRVLIHLSTDIFQMYRKISKCDEVRLTVQPVLASTDSFVSTKMNLVAIEVLQEIEHKY